MCKRWHELCHVPTLVREVALPNASGPGALHRLRSLQMWLVRHATHVRGLTVAITPDGGDASELNQLAASAAACCGPALQRFRLQLSGQQQP